MVRILEAGDVVTVVLVHEDKAGFTTLDLTMVLINCSL